jgi:hypothetical protein
MQQQSFILYLLLLLGTNFALAGCSDTHNQGGASPFDPVKGEPVFLETGSGCDRTTIGTWYAVIDPQAGTFTLEAADRVTSFHFPVTNRYPSVLSVSYYSFGPPFIADLKLKHPLPGSGIDVFDPRVIAILPANPSVSMDYPTMGIHANNSIVRQPDGYTKLWDNPTIPGNANPFKAYFKKSPYRMWSSSITTEDTVRWVLDLDGFGGPIQFLLIVDISTEYPNPPQGIIDNAPEPIELEADIISNLEPTGSGEAQIEVTVTDWQGASTIGEVAIESPLVFNGKKLLAYSGADSQPYKYKYSGSFTNELSADSGRYKILISANDSSTGITMYQEFEFQIHGDISFNIQDITPPKVSLYPLSLKIDGSFAYVISPYGPGYSTKRLDVLDLSDPVNPNHKGYFDLTVTSYQVKDGYVFYTEGTQGLKVVKMTQPSNPEVVGVIPPSSGESFGQICVEGDFAYILTGKPAVIIVDISIPENAYIHTEMPFSAAPDSFTFSNGYLYVTINQNVEIYDADPAQDIHLVYSHNIGGLKCLHMEGDYAYFFNSLGLELYDINPPTEFHYLGGINCDNIKDIVIKDNYMYVSASTRVAVYNVSDPIHISFVRDTAISSTDIEIYGDVLYNISSGTMKMYDINPPAEMYLLGEAIYATFIDKIAVSNGYVYSTSYTTGKIKIVDVDPVEDAEVVKTIDTDSEIYELGIHDGYLYVGCIDSARVIIINAKYPETAYIAGNLTLPDGERIDKIHLVDDCLYVCSSYVESGTSASWLYKCDISIPQSPRITSTYEFEGWVQDFAIQDNILYISSRNMSGSDHFDIFQMSDPENLQLISDTIFSSWISLYELTIRDGYAYIIWYQYDGSGGVYIYDIDPPESPELVATIRTNGSTHYIFSIDVTDDYIYAVTSAGEMMIIDSYPPEDANIIEERQIYSSYPVRGIAVQDNIAYTAHQNFGLRMFNLW